MAAISTAIAGRAAARSRPAGDVAASAIAVAVTERQRMCVSRPAGAASRLVRLHAPPSTYTRPPMVTGRNTHGTAHDASTASPTDAGGAARAPQNTPRPPPPATGPDPR